MVYAKGKIFYCDTEADIKNLPTDRTPGCLAKNIETGDIYLLDNSHVWVLQTKSLFGAGGSNGGSSSSQDIYLTQGSVDEDQNLILGYNTDTMDPIKVDIGVINDPLELLIEENKLEEVPEEFVQGLFNS